MSEEKTFFNHEYERDLKKLDDNQKIEYELKRTEWRNKIRKQIDDKLKDKKSIDECLTDIALFIHGMNDNIHKTILETLYISLSHLI